LTLAAAPAPTLRLTVLVPAWNEAESLPELHKGIRAELDKLTGGTEILVIDDGSTMTRRGWCGRWRPRTPR
jgi:hypothetical protein